MAVVLEQSIAETKNSHQNLSISPYKPLIGAVIENVDLTKPLSGRNRQDLNRALVEHGVIFIRNQALNDAKRLSLDDSIAELSSFEVSPLKTAACSMSN